MPSAAPRSGFSAANDPSVPDVVTQLRRSAVFRDYHRAFETITGLPLALRLPGSFQFPLQGSSLLNPFCALMAQRNNSCSACLQLQQRLEGAATHEPRTLECAAGLVESAVPVRIGESLVGYLQTGQVFLRPPTRKRFQAILREFGPPRSDSELQEFEALYFQTRVLAKNQYESMVKFLAIFAEHLAAVSNGILLSGAPGEAPAVVKARAFIATHQRENLRLRDVACAANMSSFYFCKIFKRATGFTFTHYLARARIEVVKVLLRQVHLRVTEAAFAAGFQSISQFNRVFRRIAGESASEYRRRLSLPSQAAVTETSGAE